MRKSLLRNHQPPLPPNGDRVAGVAVAIFTYTLQQFRLCTVKRSLQKLHRFQALCACSWNQLCSTKVVCVIFPPAYIAPDMYSTCANFLCFPFAGMCICYSYIRLQIGILQFCSEVQQYSSQHVVPRLAESAIVPSSGLERFESNLEPIRYGNNALQ